MKSALLLTVVAVCLLAAEAEHSRGCIYILGRCSRPCEEGTHAYTTGCGVAKSERTCDEPVARILPGLICDLSRCDCDEPNVKDKASGKCVPLSECSKKERQKIDDAKA